jgi:hypothetical protein
MVLAVLLLLSALPGTPLAIPPVSPEIDYETFKAAPSDYAAVPLWFWNPAYADIASYSDDTLRAIVQGCYKSGYGGLAVLPDWMAGYMNPTFIAKYRVVVEECYRLGMKLTLYDENGFPGGIAKNHVNGSFLTQYPNEGQKVLNKSEIELDGPAAGRLPITGISDTAQLMGIAAFNPATYEMIDLTGGYNAPSGATTVTTNASSVFTAQTGFGHEKAFDDNLSTRWNSSQSENGNGQWLSVNFGKTVKFDRISLVENYGGPAARVQSFHIEALTDSGWQTVHTGTNIGLGTGLSVPFSPAVTASEVKFVFDSITNPTVNSVSIAEARLFYDGFNIITGKHESAGVTYTASASTFFQNNATYNADKAFDGNSATRWNAGDLSGNGQYLQLNFSAADTFDRVFIDEAYDRVTSYHIEALVDGNWQTIMTGGTTIGRNKFVTVPLTTATGIKIVFDTIVSPASNSVSIWEVQLFQGSANLLHPDKNSPYCEYDLGVGKWKVMTFTLTRLNSDGFCDYLDPVAVGHFIDMTHQMYYDNFGEYFEKVFDSTFYDEPAMWRGNVWTGKYNEKFEAQYGFSPVKYYPALFYDVGPLTAYARNLLFGFRADLYANGYVKTIHDWCVAHNIKDMGHQGEEEIANPVCAVGDLMKCFKWQDVPGIDEVIFYGRIHRAVKVAASSANNWDKEQVMCEMYGATDNITVDGLYRNLFDLFAMGVNISIPHAVWYSSASNHVQYQPELSYRTEPYASALPAYNEYVSRLSYMLTGGRHVADIGMLYPIASAQTNFRFDAGYEYYKGGITPTADLNYMDISQTLTNNIRRDFTFLHPEILDERCSVDGDTLKLNNAINNEAYKVFIIPGANTISLSNLKKIKDFYDQGGKVIATRQLPYMSAEYEKDAEVQAIIQEMFGLNPAASTGPIYTASSQMEIAWGQREMIGLEPWKAGDGNSATRWESTTADNSWLSVEFNKPASIASCFIREYTAKISGFRVESWNGNAWVPIPGATGTTVGTAGTRVTFASPVTTSKLRLYVTAASGTVTVGEFSIFDDAGNNLIFPDSVEKDNAAGGKAIFIPNASAQTLKNAMDEVLPVYDVNFDAEIPDNVPGGHLSYIHRVKDNTDIYYIANSSDRKIQSYVDLRGAFDLIKMDPATGERELADYENILVDDEPVTRVHLDMDPITSAFFVTSEGASEFESITARSDPSSLAVGSIADLLGHKKTSRITVEGVASDSEKLAIANSLVSFESLNTAVATVDKSGVVTALSEGSAVIKAVYGEYETSVTIVVENVTLDRIDINADVPIVRTGNEAYVTVSGLLSDGVTVNLTKQPGLTLKPASPGLLTLSTVTGGFRVDKAADSPDSFKVGLIAELAVGGQTIRSSARNFSAYPSINYCLNGTASATTTEAGATSGYRASAAISGNRTGYPWGNGGGWNGTKTFVDQVLTVDLKESRSIDEINVVTLQDNYQNAVSPTPWMTFTKYGITEFNVQYTTSGSDTGWTDLPGGVGKFTGNDLVWNRIRFDTIPDVRQIRIQVTNGLGDYPRVIEFEAWQSAPIHDISNDSRVTIVPVYIPGDADSEFNPKFSVEAKAEIKLSLIVAAYHSDGRLVAVKVSDLSLLAGAKSELQASIQHTDNTLKYRFFIWDGNCVPLTDITGLDLLRG